MDSTLSSMNKSNKPLHIAMLPWLAFGHFMPFLHLAKLLAQKGHSISFISTTKNIKRLPEIPQNLTNQISYIEFGLPSVPGLPHGAEATSDLSYTLFPNLKLAFDGLKPQLENFLESSSPHWLIVDFAPYWAIPVASKLNVRTAFFCIYNASSLVFMFCPPSVTDTRTSLEDFIVKPNWVPFDSDLALRYFEAEKMLNCISDNVSGVTDGHRVTTIMTECHVIAPRSSYEFGPEWITLLEEICQKPVVPIGLLPPIIEEDPIDTWKPIKEWLEKWAHGTVVYVAFGSESTLNREEITELALGLELCELPFFWALKTQVEELPEGFEARTKNRGVIWTSWAPQLGILSHDSVGGFLSHSGWSSVIEGIMLRKPLILFPLFSDQGLVARIVAGKMLGYPIPREERDGSFTRSSVANSLRMVIMENEGEVYRETVKEMSRVFGDMARQQQYVDEFANYLQTHLH